MLFARRAELLNEAAAAITAEPEPRRWRCPPMQPTRPRWTRSSIWRSSGSGGWTSWSTTPAAPPAGSYEQFGDEDYQRAYELTLLSALRLTRHALPALRASGRGRIVNLTSSAVKEPNDGLLLSNVFRPGVIGWAKTISREEARHRITVNSIAPGSIAADRLVQLYASEPDPAAARRRDEAQIPGGRFGEPEEIAAAVAFLCSTGAAYVNGTTMLVDGGLAQGLLS